MLATQPELNKTAELEGRTPLLSNQNAERSILGH